MRGWENFVARPSGPLNLRFLIQPAIGIIMALRAGLHDAREDRPAYLWAIFANPIHRRDLLKEGWKDMRTTFVISAILDSIYQLIIHQSIYLFELLFTITFLALLPYLILRGPINRIARLFIEKDTPKIADDVGKSSSHIRKTAIKPNTTNKKRR